MVMDQALDVGLGGVPAFPSLQLWLEVALEAAGAELQVCGQSQEAADSLDSL